MKVKVTLNGKTADIDIPDEKLEELGLKEKKKLTGYERVACGDYYYYAQWDGCNSNDIDTRGLSDETAYDSGNYVSDKSLGKANARAETLMRRLRRFAAENGGIPNPEKWKVSDPKYTILWNHAYNGNDKMRCQDMFAYCYPGIVYFNSKEACERAIEEFKDELTWYFTEYQAMLY